MLKIANLRVMLGAAVILDGVSLGVKEGEVVTLIGPNGAGKSTLLRSISGLMGGYSGEITFKNVRLRGLPSQKIVELGIVQVPEGRRVFYNMTVYENLLLGAYCRGKKDRPETLKEVFSFFPRLFERKDQMAGTLSGGEQSMLAIGRAIMSRPHLLIMDEPCLGLAPIAIRSFSEHMKGLVEKGLTILLVEQNAKFALENAERAYVISNGRIVADGSASDIVNRDDEVRRAYLGGSVMNGRSGRESGFDANSNAL